LGTGNESLQGEIPQNLLIHLSGIFRILREKNFISRNVVEILYSQNEHDSVLGCVNNNNKKLKILICLKQSEHFGIFPQSFPKTGP
jgi:hypothetical protein